MTVRILQGDCRELLKTLPDASVHSIVTDPPYELTSARPGGRSDATRGKVMRGFMGLEWDGSGIAYDVGMWRECLRVLKPGGYLLAFGGTRTSHRMVCAIEDAGFEVRDTIMWLYGSGFPKSLDVAKAIDGHVTRGRSDSLAIAAVNAERPGEAIVRPASTNGHKGFVGSEDAGPREKRATPATDAAKQWQGWGTALKPAHEPICVARKPLAGTVAANVLEHGCGGLNIDACRVPHDEECREMAPSQANIANPSEKHRQAGRRTPVLELKPEGRWPANVIHDGSEDVLAAFPDAPGAVAPVKGSEPSGKTADVFGAFAARAASDQRDGGGSAARFFYCAKASREDRNVGCDDLESKPLNWSSGEQSPGTFQSPNTDRSARNHHPTVKPTELMRWLVRLVTPSGGTVLDPFAGSGSTGRAADIEGFNAILIELNPEYAEIARRRINGDSPLFAETA